MDRSDAELLRGARERIGLSLKEAAALVQLDPVRLIELEDGGRPVHPTVLDGYARVLGLTLSQFMEGQASTAVSSLLFRSLREDGPSFGALAESGALATLGEFLRCVHAVGELREILGESSGALEDLNRIAPPEPPIEATLLPRTEQLAGIVRQKLQLGAGPITSMVALFERLGIALFWTTPDELDVEVDAASTIAELPATLVNLVGGTRQWWRTRMTLAHELCHVIFDREFFGEGRQLALISPRAERTASRLVLPQPLELLERRARAFAVHLLVPRVALLSLVGKRDPRSEGVVTAVCQHFQVGRTTAVNQLRNLQLITEDERARMCSSVPASVLPSMHPDAEETRLGLRGGVLQALALRALSEGKIDPLRARGYLEIPPTEPLPDGHGLSVEQRAPLHSIEDRVKKHAQRRLLQHVDTADCYVDLVTPDTGGAWRVDIAQFVENDEPVSRGFLLLDADLHVAEEHLTPRAA